MAIRAGDATPDEIVPKSECRGRRCSHAVDLGLYLLFRLTLPQRLVNVFVVENLENKNTSSDSIKIDQGEDDELLIEGWTCAWQHGSGRRS